MSSSDTDDENVIHYGTPLLPYEDGDIPSKKKFLQQPDQFATDSHGRRRFHGAFTGGFSAGFGNTVGTPEGWTPSSFTSSRSDKAKLSNFKPEDFMDEEDRSEFGIAPKNLQTQSDFTGRKRSRQPEFHDGPIPGMPVLQQLLKAVHETAAVRILRRMGWHEGQGTGDRVSKGQRRKLREQHKVYGCYMPENIKPNTQSQSDEDSGDSDIDYDALYAPEDYEPYILNHKNDRFGLGYTSLSRHSVLGSLVGEYGSNAGNSRSHLVMNEKGKKVSIRGHAFGVGAMEDDDDDIYATEDMSHYDYQMGSEAIKTEKFKSKKAIGNVIEGFVKATAPLPSVANYPPPAVPRGYVPLPAGSRRTRFDTTTVQPRDQGLGRHELSAEARGALLGEKPIEESKNVLPQEITQNTNDPIVKVVGRNVNFVSTLTSEQKELDYISIKDSGKEVPRVFKPFAGEPTKQARYEKYLLDMNSVFETDGSKLSEWERNREMAEFEQAAKLYKPLTGDMGDRFTHAAEPDEGATNPLLAVAKSNKNYGTATKEQIEAAEKGFYGSMTRDKKEWRPESLVCKRFNVPDPYGGRQETKQEDRPKISYSVFSYLESSVHNKDSFTKEQTKFSGSKSLETDVLAKTNKTTESDNQNKKISSVNTENHETIDMPFNKRMTVAEMFLKESEKVLEKKGVGESDVSETINSFDKMDLYKSIFLSDSENEDDNSGKKDNVSKVNEATGVSDFVDAPKNIERNLSPPRGIFANIDFDELNSWKRKAEENQASKKIASTGSTSSTTDKNTEIQNKQNIVETVNEDEMYGPKIPENINKRLEAAIQKDSDDFKPKFRSKSERDKEELPVCMSSSEDSWVDANELKKKKHKKKKSKKHKKSKHKSKTK